MREFKFRGKCVQDSRYAGEWVEGGCAMPDEDCVKKVDEWLIVAYIGGNCSCSYHVIPETVGQFTGLLDKNNKPIYEGDIVKDKSGKVGYIGWLQQECGFVIVWEKSDSRLGHRARGSGYKYDLSLEVIGNIYENKELLEGGTK